jgi:hypothetical protein
MNILGPYRYILTGNAVIASDANESTIVNIVICYAEAKIKMTHDRMESIATMFQPFFDDVDIHHQRHRYIDVPLILEAMDALSSANDLLNSARSRLTYIRADMALVWNLDLFLKRSVGLQALLHKAEADNHDILQLFHRLHPNRTVFRTTFGSHLGSNT